MSSDLYELNRNERANARETLSTFLNNISISDMDSVRTQAGMLSMITNQPEEITRKTEVLFNFIFKSTYITQA